MTIKNRVAIYVRVSGRTQAEEGISLEAQEAKLRQAVASIPGATVSKVYCDAGISGAKFDRPALQEMLSDMRNGCFGTILVWNFSRLSRSLQQLLTLVDELSKYNVTLQSFQERVDLSTSGGKFILEAMGSVAQMQRESWAESARIGRRKKAQEGKYPQVRILGYDLVDDSLDVRGAKKLEVNPKEARVVRIIFVLYARGKGYKQIATYLNRNGYTTKAGNTFSIFTVKYILSNNAYIGYVKYKGEPYKGKHDPIVSERLWRRVQDRLGCHTPVLSNGGYAHLLSGLIKCPECGASMIATHTCGTLSNGERKQYYYYVCNNYWNSGLCHANSVKAKEADSVVMDDITKHISSPVWRKMVSKRILASQSPSKNIAKARKTAQDHIKMLEVKQRNLLNRYEEGKITLENFKLRAHNLKEEKEKERYDLVRLDRADDKPTVTAEEIQNALNNMREILIRQKADNKRMLLRSIVKDIHVNECRQVKEINLYEPMRRASGATIKLVLD